MTTPLAGILRGEIARRGPIPFRDFMEAALYHPIHGYYSSGRARIGRAGDFFTNISVGALFGKLLARQFAEMWERLGKPHEFSIVEQGAHGGEFARDVMGALMCGAPDCFAAAIYQIIEPAELLRSAQSERLADFDGKVHWVSSLEDLPAFTGVHFSNELLDAFPVHAVIYTGAAWRERHVDRAGEGFVFVDGPLSSSRLRDILARMPEVPAGYCTEINLAALDWVAGLAAKMTRGFVLAIDYGFPRDEYHRPGRTSGTLTGYARHRRVDDVLESPGEIDLTAHVDFTSLAEHAERAGLRLTAFTDQHHFMVGLGRLHFGGGAPPDDEAARELRAFKTLMHPNLMGVSFKVLLLEKGVAPSEPLAGFSFARDPRGALGL